MEQRIQYSTAADGTRIAFAVSGEGSTLISVPAPPDNHVELEWADPDRRKGLEEISSHVRLVRFDGRGTGLSDREVGDLSIAGRVSDLEAVVEKLGVDRVSLISGGHGNQVAVAYAAKHPERVARVIAVNPFTRGSDFMSPEQLSLYKHMLATDFRIFTDVVAAETFGFGREEGPRYAAYFRAAVEPHMAARIYDAMLEVDMSADLAALKCPVLVVRAAESSMVPEGVLREFAAAIHDLHLVTIPGRPTEGASDAMIERVAEFMGDDWRQSGFETRDGGHHHDPDEPLEFRTVLFTDIEHHTRMMHRLGDAAGRNVLRIHEQSTREALRQFGGTEVKTMGDGFLASFRSVQRALDCAVALQQRLCAGGHEGLPEDFRIRVGINAGEPIEEDGDLFGSSVITAARIVSLAEGGEILVSNVVRELVAGKGHLFADRGLHELRGFDEPVRVWSLRWGEGRG